MAFMSGDVAVVTIGGVDISGAIESAKLDRKAKDERHHVLGGNPVITLVHAPEFTFTLKGMITPEVSSIFTSNFITAAPTVACLYEPQGAGGMSRSFNARVTDYSDDTAGDKTGMFDATMAVDGAIVDA